MGKLIVTNTPHNITNTPSAPVQPEGTTLTLTLGSAQSHLTIEVVQSFLQLSALRHYVDIQTATNLEPKDISLDHIFINQRAEVVNPIKAAYLLHAQTYHPDSMVQVYEVKDCDVDRVRFTDEVITPIQLRNQGYSAPANHEWATTFAHDAALAAYAPLLFIAFSDKLHLRESLMILNEMLGSKRLRKVTIDELRILIGGVSKASLDKYKQRLGLTRKGPRNLTRSHTHPQLTPQPTQKPTEREVPQHASQPKPIPDPRKQPQLRTSPKQTPSVEKPASSAQAQAPAQVREAGEHPEQTDLFE